MPTNYNAVHGYGHEPRTIRGRDHAERRPGRSCRRGAQLRYRHRANFWAGNVGTETSGSILSPSNQNMLAAIKPTVGRISRYGVIPITADQDTPGPMAKYVSDIAIMFGALENASPDPNDAATEDMHAAARTRLHEVPEGPTVSRGRASAFRARPTTSPSIRPSSGPSRRPAPRPRQAGAAGRGGGRGGLNPEQTK
jgi:hypothetical protein